MLHPTVQLSIASVITLLSHLNSFYLKFFTLIKRKKKISFILVRFRVIAVDENEKLANHMLRIDVKVSKDLDKQN